ncbi:MAG TPA: HAMP domain-containing protein [Caldithrix abyssi]|uniref:HAMP domain-containing protein n=1 Tax=Caldithrix abyssi TaxID=187145 RepID=A0A7V5RPT2_CALAY|nr:HAMP domain-containing protein [Caldithrix abyssi]
MTIRKQFQIFCSAFGALVIISAILGLIFTTGYGTFIMGTALAILLLITVGYGMLAKMLLRPLADFESIARGIARGDLEARIPYKGSDELGSLAVSINSMVDTLNQNHQDDQRYIREVEQVIGDIGQVIKELKMGQLGSRASSDTSYENLRELQASLNEVVTTLVEPIRQTSALLEEYAHGNLDNSLKVLPGELGHLSRATSDIRGNLKNLIKDSKTLATAALEGDFSTKGDINRYQGEYREVIDSLNKLFENMLQPLHEAETIIEQLSRGNFSAYSGGSYQGEHARLHETLNATIRDFNRLLGEIFNLTRQISGGVNQIAENNESLAHGATRQAASIQQISRAIEDLTSKTQHNAENAGQVNDLVRETKSYTESGNTRMNEMLNAMGEISASSEKISKIINSIEEIAFQTNLLALNAAVEAARAGVHGKGFAVVAEEVRNLAQRSARAANETTDLIGDTVSKVQNGTRIANETAGALEQINGQIGKVSDLVQEITHSSKEQTENIIEIQSSIREIDQVTQENTARAEESAASSQDITSYVHRLQQMMSRFKLDSRFMIQDKVTSLRKAPELSLSTGEDTHRLTVSSNEAENGDENHALEKSSINIELDDPDFGEF